MADGTAFRKSVRAHMGAGCLAVAGIAGLTAAYLFPVVLKASSRGPREAGFSAGLVLGGSVAFALAIWLLFYLPSSIVADMITRGRPARPWLSAVLCWTGLTVVTFALVNRHDQRPHALATGFLLFVAIVISLGCALYSFLKTWLASREPRERSLAP